MKMSLDKKILAGFALCTVVLVVVATESFRNGNEFKQTSSLVTQTHEVLYELEQILLHTVSAESGARAYAITADENQLEPFIDSRSKIADHVRRVRRLTENNPQQQDNLNDLERLLAPRLANMDEYVEMCRKGQFEEARKLITSGEGKRLQDAVRMVLTNAREIEQSLLDQRQQSSETEGENFTRLFIILLGVILVTLIVVYIIIVANLNALRRAEAEAADRNWNLTGSGELAKKMQGNMQVDELARTIIAYLAVYLDFQVGTLYVMDEPGQKLHAAGKYAWGDERSETIHIGQGVIGQCATEGRTIILSEIPDDYFIINSGFGKVLPKSIVAVPLVFESQIIGVIAGGCIRPFKETHVKFLQMVADSIAIAIASSFARTKTRELLEETQRQAEELEAQQEELRQANDELHAKTDMLERSELELKAQQEELQQVNIELEEKANMLEEQKDILENAKIEIEKKAIEVEVTSKYKSEFLANMSHELRTPLNSILILSQLLSENRNDRLGSKEIEYSTNIHNSGKDLLNLINEILDLSKIESGKMDLEINDVPIKDIVDGLSSMFSEIAASREIVFDFTYEPEDGLALRTDRQRVDQILRNLLSNAFKFTEKGGRVSLSVGPPGASVVFKSKTLLSSPSVIAFTVSDTGIGIPKDKRGVIFEAFQQADGSTKRKYGGTGLGLSISRELSLALGGEIQLESEPGKGSVFTLYLPTDFNPSYISAERPVEVKESVTARRTHSVVRQAKDFPMPSNVDDDRYKIGENDRVVLIIEDEVPFANLLLDFVRSRHYKGIIALQGNTGLSFARHHKPDAILLDMKLPVMEGTEVLQQLKKDPQLRHIPVQIISSFDRRKEGLELGAFGYAVKPISRESLDAAFDNLEAFSSKKFKKLLIVEDDKRQNDAIRELIGNGDVKCSSAYSGTDAYTILEKESIDCIILDLGLPDMSGFDLLEKIKSNKGLNRIPVIVYTGKELQKSDALRLNKLADTVVLKTVNSHERLLDETTLFLHRVESKLPREKQRLIRSLHNADEILKGKTVLLVDDDIRNIYSLTNVLEDEGISCITAENGLAAIKCLHENRSIDLVLMDVMMPEMDGYEATIEIRKMNDFGKLPIIALTAKAMKGDKEKCLAVGMSDYISKPVNVEQLLSLMRVWLYK